MPEPSTFVEISPELHARREQLQEQGAFEKVKAECEAKVVSWRWATVDKADPDPFWSQKYGYPAGRWLKVPPSDPHGDYRHGADDEGRFVVVREGSGFKGRFDEEFYYYTPDRIEVIGYDRFLPRKVVEVSWYSLDSGRPVRSERLNINATTAKVAEYRYQNDRLVEEIVYQRGLVRNERVERHYHFQYDDRGRLDRIEFEYFYLDGQRENVRGLVYRRPKKGESIARSSSEIEELLVQLIPDKLRAARVSEPLFCLLLVYDWEGNPPLPPLLALGPQSLRQRAREKHGREARCYLWNPADYPTFGAAELELTDAKLLEACDLLNQMMSSRDYFQPARTLLNKVAARLQQHDWRGILETTDDFFVAAVDLESQDHLQPNMKKSVPTEIIKRLKKESYL